MHTFAGYPGGDPFPRGHVGPSQFKNYTFLTPLAGGVLNPASKVEYTQAYNFAIEQDLGNGFAVNVGYVGNHAEHVMASRQFNPVRTHDTDVRNHPHLYRAWARWNWPTPTTGR